MALHHSSVTAAAFSCRCRPCLLPPATCQAALDDSDLLAFTICRVGHSPPCTAPSSSTCRLRSAKWRLVQSRLVTCEKERTEFFRADERTKQTAPRSLPDPWFSSCWHSVGGPNPCINPQVRCPGTLVMLAAWLQRASRVCTVVLFRTDQRRVPRQPDGNRNKNQRTRGQGEPACRAMATHCGSVTPCPAMMLPNSTLLHLALRWLCTLAVSRASVRQ